MSNKIIKISIVLIFMLFVTGLFNFCFALTSDNKLEETDYTVTSSMSHNIVYTGNVTFNFIKLNVNYEKLSANNTDTDLSGLDMDKAFYILSDSKELYCLIPEQYNEEDEYNWYCDNQSDYGFRKAFGTSSKVTQHCFYYDFSINKWVFLKTANKFSFNNNHYILNDNIVPIYSKSADTSSEFIVYEPVIIPPTEELIAGCDFKVNFKFNPDNSDFPTKIDHHLYLYDECLVTHEMSNWSQYKVDMSITLNRKSQYGGSDSYFELYNSTGEKIIEKSNILYNSIISSELSENDFYVLFSDNVDNIIKITYYIKNINNELLFSKEYTLKFSSGGFGSVNLTGTIITENAYDSNGELIDKGNTSFDTNGYDDTDYSNGNYGFDSLYKMDEETLKNNAKNLISGSEDFFSLMALFLYMLPSWISSLIYLFLFGMVIITLLRFARGA